MIYVARRCQCGHPQCTSWHVELRMGGRVKAFSERQIGVVVNALNALENYRERSDHTDDHLDQ